MSGQSILDWDAIIKAYDYMLVSKVAKIEGDNWKMHWIGLNMIRIDINIKVD